MDVANSLISLRSRASIVDLKAGDSLFRDNTGVIIEERGSGLFFIEHGMIVSRTTQKYNFICSFPICYLVDINVIFCF